MEGARSAAACDPAWLEGWRAWEAGAQRAIARVVKEIGLSEPGVARTVYHQAASRGRDDRCLGVHADPRPRVVRRARGGGTAGPGQPRGQRDRRRRLDRARRRRRQWWLPAEAATAPSRLLGDLAFLHDVSGLVNLPAVPCTFVVVDNGGGGIFSFLPQAGAIEEATFEALFGTPPTSDVVSVARGFGLPVHEVGTLPELEAALAATAPAGNPGPGLIRARVPRRAENVALHEQINEAVRRALA